MKFKLGLAQLRHPDDGDALALVRHWTHKAANNGVEMLVFPESLMSPFEKERQAFLNDAQPLDGSFTTAVDALACEYNLWLVYTLNEANPDGLPFNTAIVTGNDGRRRGLYRKVHLFDSATVKESERMSAANEFFEPIDTFFGKLGLSICYDLRFPEWTRRAALAGCTLMLFPSAWVDGPSKLCQWQTLLKARAIENEIFVAGVSRCDDGYVGSSIIVAPDGEVLASAGRDEQLLCATINTDLIEKVRNAIPVFKHRKPKLY